VTPVVPALYVDDVFSTYLYEGNASSQTIAPGVNLADNGGAFWLKRRQGGSGNWSDHWIWDNTRTGGLRQNLTNSNFNADPYNPVFTTTGATLQSYIVFNESGADYVTWLFRKQPKFFDVVSYTGTGSTSTRINHSLGSLPGMIIIKRTDSTSNWGVWHIGTGIASSYSQTSLNLTSTATSGNYTGLHTSTQFAPDYVYDSSSAAFNTSGATYVAYLFAHNAGGFGASGNDNVISCGRFSTTGQVTLGWEPQWILMKSVSNTSDWTGDWRIFDNMRGVGPTDDDAFLSANSSREETTIYYGTAVNFNATGFNVKSQGSYGDTIYVAIRRPMKPPTVGTSVFTTVLQSNNSAGTLRTVGFAADTIIGSFRTSTGNPAKIINSRLTNGISNRLVGSGQTTPGLQTNTTNAEANGYPLFYKIWNTTARDGDYIYNSAGTNWMFRRAPTFMDSVLYTGTGSQQNISHNLTIAPELVITKRRSAAGASWAVWATSLSADESLALNTTDSKTAVFSVGFWGSTYPTSSVFTVGSNINTNSTSQTYIAHLFATCPGVSKVGSYTGTGALQTINCGFTTGARFILIKRTDSSGAWYVWDSARGISSGTDPYSNINDSAAETTGTNYVDTVSTGFQVTAAATADINASGATYIFLAIA
jgi:hypothetical protein